MTSLNSVTREGKQTKSALNQLRHEGKIPAVVYGYGAENTSVYVAEKEFGKVIREVGRNGVIELNVDSQPVKVMVSDYQVNPLKNQITHIDFLAINMKAELTVDVTVTLIGEAAGAAEGGVVQQPLFTVSVTATPDDIPETIEVDVTSLNIGDVVTVGDLRTGRNFTINNEDDETVVSVVPPTVEEPAEDAEEGTEEAAEDQAEGNEEQTEEKAE
ncbi:50S ribosomal protein L25/general stress protein Ctc [Macrococcus equipercicus]|uniref:Large ribosomal subunit protein bL25 n=1 Tax=Macrococcus equipercicus TaxID=69967 RepID=A0A9Q9F1G7_9STAP|nr:50S ribosomal protein L25/general stress protein Ctc [Macrococcus equipercicus]KAA1036176.1 50S ribosomal protein L25/general stress protein Ctc [Macrococcus equipercicus]UTH13735.1 50S ribosomal protein L25/general stress protein Ctc [Macrococcus equipercicus]